MCGLFGTIRPHQYPQELRTIAATALIDLGYLAEERGVDSAGIATLHSRALSPLPHTGPAVREHTLGRWRIRIDPRGVERLPGAAARQGVGGEPPRRS